MTFSGLFLMMPMCTQSQLNTACIQASLLSYSTCTLQYPTYMYRVWWHRITSDICIVAALSSLMPRLSLFVLAIFVSLRYKLCLTGPYNTSSASATMLNWFPHPSKPSQTERPWCPAKGHRLHQRVIKGFLVQTIEAEVRSRYILQWQNLMKLNYCLF